MFSGWRLANSYRSLASLGTGTLPIDALGGSCEFDSEPVEAPSIAEELRHWSHEDLAAQRIAPETLDRATLTATLTFSAVPPGQRATNECYLRSDGRAVRSAEFYRCAIACESEVATDKAVCR